MKKIKFFLNKIENKIITKMLENALKIMISNLENKKKYRKVVKKGLFFDTTYFIEK